MIFRFISRIKDRCSRSRGDWFETIIRKIIGSKIVCHFWGFASIWDCTIEYDPAKIAPVYTHSEKSKYKDNEKLLGECVWEILSYKNMLDQNKQCTQSSLQILIIKLISTYNKCSHS